MLAARLFKGREFHRLRALVTDLAKSGQQFGVADALVGERLFHDSTTS